MRRRFRRGPFLNLPRVAVAAGALIVAAAAAVVAAGGLHPSRPASPLIMQPASAPLAPEERRLARCQRLGEAGAHDAECLRIWAEMRERFLGGADVRRVAPSLSAAGED
ncbi:putative entry exclusion protein TrbK-alt [Phenylobacterium montanum]|uniref:Entry exclusion protein TrbK-alt n=1 Tax=Phenylobacterium montanum TaxID=2823693 RepID=A0A975G3D7_9CAUL|nr:putative entry exclusion protein TrbK-alt [Caulobacter sp. S6]QUD90145.1 putative entry exclusion protein TrbK-alt [Caulobacter sp. S6]